MSVSTSIDKHLVVSLGMELKVGEIAWNRSAELERLVGSKVKKVLKMELGLTRKRDRMRAYEQSGSAIINACWSLQLSPPSDLKCLTL